MSFWNLFTEHEPRSEPPPSPPLCAVESDPKHVCWGLENLPLKYATEHFLACGTIGSGKTTMIRLLLQSIAPRFVGQDGPAEQLIIFDAQGTALPILDGMGIHPDREDLWILNPFDERGVRWNIGAAINSPAMARYFASLIIPHEDSTAPYFNNAARQLVYWVIISLAANMKERWTLRDLINSLESKDRILAVTSNSKRAKTAVMQHFNDTANFGGVLSSLETKIGQFHEVAALWHTAKSERTFSVERFLKGRGILVLGYDPVLHESMWPMNAIILKALTNEILREEPTPGPRHWFILDEFRAMQKVDCIRNLLNLCRAKGASVLLGIQSIDGLREIYGQHATEDILEACSNKTFLRAGGAQTAEWAEKHFNKVRQTERSTSVSHGPTGTTNSTNFQTQERSLFLASEFLTFPQPRKGGAFCAVNDIPCFEEVVVNDWLADDVFEMLKPLGSVPGVLRREDPFEQYLKRWSAKEEAEICGTTSPDTPLESESGSSSDDIPTKDSQQKRRYRK